MNIVIKPSPKKPLEIRRHGKGDTTRPFDKDKFAQRWDEIFGKKPVKSIKET